MTPRVRSAALALLVTATASAGEIDRTLRDILDGAAPGAAVSALAYLDARVDVAALDRDFEAVRAPRAVRHEWVVRTLQDMAAATQGPLLDHLERLREAGRIESFQPLWIVNAVQVRAARAELEALAARPDVGIVYYDFEIEGIKPVEVGPPAPAPGGAAAGGPEPGLVAIRAPEAWALGYTGQGVLVSSLDTGVEGTHPALASRWRGLDPAYAGHPEWAWFDPVTDTNFPQQFGFHGTHTMGTICGGAPGAPIGVAPGSDWIHAAVIDRVSIPQTVSDSILAFQWLIDPDENPATVSDVPRVNSNSWGLADFHGYPDCDQAFWGFLDACEAAGIVIVFAAGNEGFSGLRRPADRATDDYRTFAVAAVDGNTPGYPIAGFSSRGPTNCAPGGASAIKPDIAAPGVFVISAFPGGGYGPSDGTSMATPHIAGVVALMYSANPDLTVQQVKQIIYDTAADLGTPGQDNNYGWGIADAYEAVLAAEALYVLTFEFPGGQPDFIDAQGTTSVPVLVVGHSAAPVPGSGRLHYSTDGANYAEVPMTETAPNEYEAVFPPVPCGATVSYYFSAEAEGGATVNNPFTAPDAVYQRIAFNGEAVAIADDGEQNQGWTADVVGATAGQWQRGVPVNDPAWPHAPAADGDGSGQCWLTQNTMGNSDVDNGAVRLTSPVLDLAASAEVDAVSIDYLYYLTLDHPDPGDGLRVEISTNGAAGPWTTVAAHDTGSGAAWLAHTISEADLADAGVTPTSATVVRFIAGDLPGASIVEAGLDGISIARRHCDKLPACPFDLDGSGDVGINDLLGLLADWGNPYDINDLLDLLAAWGPC